MQVNKVIANSYNCESNDIYVAQLLSDEKLKKIQSVREYIQEYVLEN